MRISKYLLLEKLVMFLNLGVSIEPAAGIVKVGVALLVEP
jgi:hypothetical protein